MEQVERNISINKVGGTAGKNSVNYRVSLPAEWVKKIGVTAENRKTFLEFDGEKIIIKKI